MKTAMSEEKVFEGFMSGVCCSMAVFGAMASRLGIEEEKARRIASAFGSGMGHGAICGCVTGAWMALGLKYGNSEPGEVEKMQLLAAKKQEFEERFTSKYGSLVCPEMLDGLNPAIPEQLGEMVEKGVMRNVCAPAVCAACEILEEMFDEKSVG